MMKISVLMTVHNRKEKTLTCLDNLFRQKVPNNISIDVYLTDDGCTDGTPEAVKITYPNVHIIKGDGNLFWNRGMYLAWANAEKFNYDFYIWLNYDTFLFENSLSYLLESYKSLGGNCIIAGATCSKINSSETTYSGFIGKNFIPVIGKFQ